MHERFTQKTSQEIKRKLPQVSKILLNSVDFVPLSAPTPCRYPGCAAVLVKPGYCDAHHSAIHRDYGRARRGFDSERGFYQSTQWRAVRAIFLRKYPLCVHCQQRGRMVAAVVVDHIQPLKQGGARFDDSNLQALCVSCHNRKTASETAQHSRRN